MCGVTSTRNVTSDSVGLLTYCSPRYTCGAAAQHQPCDAVLLEHDASKSTYSFQNTRSLQRRHCTGAAQHSLADGLLTCGVGGAGAQSMGAVALAFRASSNSAPAHSKLRMMCGALQLPAL